jgi:hypothetical protein
MKQYKMKSMVETNKSCGWVWEDGSYQRHNVDAPFGGTINGKYFCEAHLNQFRDIDRQFKILEEIKEEKECSPSNNVQQVEIVEKYDL